MAFCASCLDSGCGMMWSTAISMSALTVVWEGLGWEVETWKLQIRHGGKGPNEEYGKSSPAGSPGHSSPK